MSLSYGLPDLLTYGLNTTFVIMAYKEREEISKIYYTMGEVSAMFDVNQSLLRYYEKKFEILQPKNKKKSNRFFTAEDVENLKIILHLIRDKKFTLDGAKAHMKENIDASKSQQRIITS